MPLPMLPIVIIERSGLRRPVVFFNAMLPRRGGYTNFDMRQRTKVNRYAGNAQASGQVLGPEFLPIRFSGFLEDRRIGVPGASVAAALWIKTVAKAGRECIFNYGPFFYRVLWKQVGFQVVELQRIKYKIELEVLDDFLASASGSRRARGWCRPQTWRSPTSTTRRRAWTTSPTGSTPTPSTARTLQSPRSEAAARK